MLAAAALAVLVAVLGALPALRALLWHQELTPILRGRLLAQELGCFACHLPIAGGEIPNPGSRWGSVPRFAAGNAMMYAPERTDVEEFVRFGAPRDWLDDAVASERLDRQHLRMPAYGERLNDDEIADLVAFVCAVEGIGFELAGGAAAGRELARRHGCLACHGVDGSGGLPNPGSLGGFIPGFIGDNFPDLVRDESEFREWVREGTSSRLASNPVLRVFFRRQAVSMPAYGEELDEREIGELWTWVKTLRQGR